MTTKRQAQQEIVTVDDTKLFEELESIRGCWNIYVDDDGNLHPNCPVCTEDVELDWEYCLNCGYPEYDFDEEEDDGEEAQESAPADKADRNVDWKKSGF